MTKKIKKNKYHNPGILSGREGSMDSSAKAFRMTGEGGRSMVEMLGVLAIIGVLSVGGIAGYTMAMNKYRANEILNGASMRAMVVATQIQMKPSLTNPNLGEFTGDTPAGVTIGVKTRAAADKQFILTLSGVAKEVCDQMKAVVPDNSQNPVINCEANPITMTYNADLGSGTASAGLDKNKCTTAGGELKGGDQYCLFETDMDWGQAYERCDGIGGSMVSLSDFGCPEEMDASCPTSGDKFLPSDLSSITFWTFDCYDNTCEDEKLTNKTSGFAYLVDDGIVNAYSRDEGGNVLCK